MKLVALVLVVSACTSGVRWGTAIGGTLVGGGLAMHETIGDEAPTNVALVTGGLILLGLYAVITVSNGNLQRASSRPGDHCV